VRLFAAIAASLIVSSAALSDALRRRRIPRSEKLKSELIEETRREDELEL
jgi:hypothetical protein